MSLRALGLVTACLSSRRLLAACLLAFGMLMLLSGCAWLAVPPEPVDPLGAARPESAELAEWSPRELPGKPRTRYSLAQRGGQTCLLAQADKSASLWRRFVRVDPQQIASLEFDWWIGPGSGAGDVAVNELDDAPARLVLAFDGDGSRLSMRNRMLFELAQTLTGEAPPYATLMYVWNGKASAETVIVSERSDRIRKLVVGSGPGTGRGWQAFRRNVVADYERAFGEPPGTLIGMAFMTDADNTRGRAEACYGRLILRDAQQQGLPGSLLF